jgi:hypothetical protein
VIARLRRVWPVGANRLPRPVLAAILTVAAALSLYSILPVIEAVFTGYYAFDWVNFVEAGARLGRDDLYEIDDPYAFRWSPMAAAILGVVTLLPLWLWQVLHVAVLPMLRSWWLVAACLVTYPLWFDIQTGNIMIFVAVTGFWALRENRLATALFLGLTVLVPRPLMIPLAAWILWHRPAWRIPFILFFAAHTMLVLASGYATEWISALLTVETEFTSDFNYGPSRLIGLTWVPIGIGLAAWMTWRNRLGLASLAISPYWLPYYFLILLLEYRPMNAARQGRIQTADVESE